MEKDTFEIDNSSHNIIKLEKNVNLPLYDEIIPKKVNKLRIKREKRDMEKHTKEKEIIVNFNILILSINVIIY